MRQSVNYQNYLLVSLTVMLVAICVTMVQYKIPTIIPGIAASGIMTIQQTTFLMSVFTGIGIFLALPAGFLVHRLGAKNALLITVGIICITSLGILSGNMIVIYICRVFEGIAITLLIVSGPVFVNHKILPEKRGVATGIWVIGGMFGAFFAGILTPTIFDLGGLNGVWLSYALLSLAAGILLFFVVDDKRGEPDHTSKQVVVGGVEGAEPVTKKAEVVPKGTYKVLLGRNMLLFYCSFVVFQVLLLTTLTFLPTSLQQSGFNPTLSGLVSTLPMLLSIVTSIVFGALSDRTGHNKVLYLIGFVGMALGVFLMFTRTDALLWVGVALMGLLGMGTPTVALSAFPKLIQDPKLISIGMGLLVVVQSIGQFVGTTVPQLILGPDLTLWMPMILTVMCISAVGFVLGLLCRFK